MKKIAKIFLLLTIVASLNAEDEVETELDKEFKESDKNVVLETLKKTFNYTKKFATQDAYNMSGTSKIEKIKDDENENDDDLELEDVKNIIKTNKYIVAQQIASKNGIYLEAIANRLNVKDKDTFYSKLQKNFSKIFASNKDEIIAKNIINLAS